MSLPVGIYVRCAPPCRTYPSCVVKHQIRNEVVGKEPFDADLQAGSFYWGDHLANPIIHKVKQSEGARFYNTTLPLP